MMRFVSSLSIFLALHFFFFFLFSAVSAETPAGREDPFPFHGGHEQEGWPQAKVHALEAGGEVVEVVSSSTYHQHSCVHDDPKRHAAVHGHHRVLGRFRPDGTPFNENHHNGGENNAEKKREHHNNDDNNDGNAKNGDDEAFGHYYDVVPLTAPSPPHSNLNEARDDSVQHHHHHEHHHHRRHHHDLHHDLDDMRKQKELSPDEIPTDATSSSSTSSSAAKTTPPTISTVVIAPQRYDRNNRRRVHTQEDDSQREKEGEGGDENLKMIRQRPFEGAAATAAAATENENNNADDFNNTLRIVWRTPDIDAAAAGTSRYCTGNPTADATVPDYIGGIANCTSATPNEAVFTSAKRAFLMDDLLPAAAAKFASILRLTNGQIGGGGGGNNNLRVPTTSACGAQVTIPVADTTSGGSGGGVANADLVIYITAVPSPTSAAFASYCALDTNGRPIVGHMNFNPIYLVNTKTFDRQIALGIVLHELMHVLGFSYGYITSAFFKPPASFVGPIIQTGTSRRGGQPVTLYRGPAALAAARVYFNCSSLDGIELEDEGLPTYVKSHWERRFHQEDVMSSATPVRALTAVTLGVLVDSGHYYINPGLAENRSSIFFITSGGGSSSSSSTIISSSASPAATGIDTPSYMRNVGCSVFSSPCNTTAGGLGRYFCNNRTEVAHCTPDWSGIGKCHTQTYASNLPLWAQYFAKVAVAAGGGPKVGGPSNLFFNYCPVVVAWPNRVCNDPQSNAGTSDHIGGFVYDTDSRCFQTSDDVVMYGYGWPVGQTPGPARCLRTRCYNGSYVQFRIGYSWADCPLNGSSATLKLSHHNFHGSLVCPKAADFCTRELFYLPPALTIPPPPTTSTTAAPTTTTVGTTSAPPTPTTTTTSPPATSTTTNGGAAGLTTTANPSSSTTASASSSGATTTTATATATPPITTTTTTPTTTNAGSNTATPSSGNGDGGDASSPSSTTSTSTASGGGSEGRADGSGGGSAAALSGDGTSLSVLWTVVLSLLGVLMLLIIVTAAVCCVRLHAAHKARLLKNKGGGGEGEGGSNHNDGGEGGVDILDQPSQLVLPQRQQQLNRDHNSDIDDDDRNGRIDNILGAPPSSATTTRRLATTTAGTAASRWSGGGGSGGGSRNNNSSSSSRVRGGAAAARRTSPPTANAPYHSVLSEDDNDHEEEEMQEEFVDL